MNSRSFRLEDGLPYQMFTTRSGVQQSELEAFLSAPTSTASTANVKYSKLILTRSMPATLPVELQQH